MSWSTDLMDRIVDAFPDASVDIAMYSGFCVVCVLGLPTGEFVERRPSLGEYPNSVSVAWCDGQALMTVRRLEDRDVDAALATAWSMLSLLRQVSA